MHEFLKFIFGINLYMFRTVPLSIIRSFSLCTQQYIRVCSQLANSIRIDPDRKLSENLYDIHHYCDHSEKLLTMDRGTARNM
jgi:hypothetical protein